MALHNRYLVALCLLFVVALAITLVSLVAHRRAFATAREPFFGPTGDVQFVWAMIPIAILLAVGYALIEKPAERRAGVPDKIALAAVPPTAKGEPTSHAAAGTPARGLH